MNPRVIIPAFVFFFFAFLCFRAPLVIPLALLVGVILVCIAFYRHHQSKKRIKNGEATQTEGHMELAIGFAVLFAPVGFLLIAGLLASLGWL